MGLDSFLPDAELDGEIRAKPILKPMVLCLFTAPFGAWSMPKRPHAHSVIPSRRRLATAFWDGSFEGARGRPTPADTPGRRRAQIQRRPLHAVCCLTAPPSATRNSSTRLMYPVMDSPSTKPLPLPHSTARDHTPRAENGKSRRTMELATGATPHHPVTQAGGSQVRTGKVRFFGWWR